MHNVMAGEALEWVNQGSHLFYKKNSQFKNSKEGNGKPVVLWRKYMGKAKEFSQVECQMPL